jgi:hypothetical protein
MRLGQCTSEIAISASVDAAACGGKDRQRLIAYSCLPLDDQRRPKEFARGTIGKGEFSSESAGRVRCGCDKTELRMKQLSHKGAALAGTIDLGDLTVNRLGFGAMRLCGDYAWGRPRDRQHVNRFCIEQSSLALILLTLLIVMAPKRMSH